jgi:hypothetical protein
MKLTELQPVLLEHREFEGDVHCVAAASLESAEGLAIMCPACRGGNDHRHVFWTHRGLTPHTVRLSPGRWRLVGTGFGDLTLEPDPPTEAAILIGAPRMGCSWRGGRLIAGEVVPPLPVAL